MAENGQALIKLDGVTKVFFTDVVPAPERV